MTVFRGCMPALMTPCDTSGKPNYDALVSTASHLIAEGMSAVVYCGSMGDWPLLTDQQRQEGVRLLVSANIPVIVGTGSQNTTSAESHAAHAAR
ncbi:MAG: dihydrodipicolinate synthase family protein, partial [Pirellulales bacterium]|nr:dihydrodipicolinate synthase family protein [Pirellulales bacterium]